MAAFVGAGLVFAGVTDQCGMRMVLARMPVLIGGEGPSVLQRVVEYGDGWIPNEHPEVLDRDAGVRVRPYRTFDDLEALMAEEINRRAVDAIASVGYVVTHASPGARGLPLACARRAGSR